MSNFKYVGFKDLPRRTENEPESPGVLRESGPLPESGPSQQSGPLPESTPQKSGPLPEHPGGRHGSGPLPESGPLPASAPPRESGPSRRSSPLPRSTPTGSRVVEPPATKVEILRNYARVMMSVFDDLLPTLPAIEQLTYLQLYRLSYGHGRDWCKIGTPRLAERAGLGESTVRKALRGLERKALVEVVEHYFGNVEQGTLFRVSLPPSTPPESFRVLSSSGPLQESGPALRSGPLRSGAMKENSKESHERRGADAPAPSIYEIRTIGARLFERHRNDLGFDHARLAELVADALAAQGIAPHGELIEEAIRGMAS